MTHGTSVFNLSDRTQIEVTGLDRARFLHNFTTNDIKRLTPGQGCETFLTNLKGKVVAHFFVFCAENSLWLDGTAGQEDAIKNHLGKFIIIDDVQLIPRTPERGELFVSGPSAAECLGLDVPLPLANQIAREIGGVPAQIRRVDLLGEPGFLVSVPRSQFASVEQSLAHSGAVVSSPEVFQARRIKAGYPEYGIDIAEDNLCQEVARTPQCISFNKGCYLGQETVARINSMGHVNRELRRIEFQTDVVPKTGSAVFASDGTTEVGVITSAAMEPASSDSTKYVAAIGLLKRIACDPNTEVKLVSNNGSSIGKVI